jgi:hypothetical protein
MLILYVYCYVEMEMFLIKVPCIVQYGSSFSLCSKLYCIDLFYYTHFERVHVQIWPQFLLDKHLNIDNFTATFPVDLLDLHTSATLTACCMYTCRMGMFLLQNWTIMLKWQLSLWTVFREGTNHMLKWECRWLHCHICFVSGKHKSFHCLLKSFVLCQPSW